MEGVGLEDKEEVLLSSQGDASIAIKCPEKDSNSHGGERRNQLI